MASGPSLHRLDMFPKTGFHSIQVLNDKLKWFVRLKKLQLLGKNSGSSAFVYGAMSFTDKVSVHSQSHIGQYKIMKLPSFVLCRGSWGTSPPLENWGDFSPWKSEIMFAFGKNIRKVQINYLLYTRCLLGGGGGGGGGGTTKFRRSKKIPPPPWIFNNTHL